jgi:ferredoxin, 2Fe-2S
MTDMPWIKYIGDDGTDYDAEVPNGQSVMEGGTTNSIPGILAICGGVAACATCHVYVEDPWLEKVPPMRADEESLLEFALDRQDNSRLSCQITVTPALDGMVVKLPKNQQ